MAYKFEIYKDKAGEIRARFKYNGEVMFSSEGYTSKQSALNLIESVKKNAPGAPVEDSTPHRLNKPDEADKVEASPGVVPAAWLIRSTAFGRQSFVAGKMFKSLEAAEKAAKRISNHWRKCEAVPVFEAGEP